jgi:hypothetical protein
MACRFFFGSKQHVSGHPNVEGWPLADVGGGLGKGVLSGNWNLVNHKSTIRLKPVLQTVGWKIGQSDVMPVYVEVRQIARHCGFTPAAFGIAAGNVQTFRFCINLAVLHDL